MKETKPEQTEKSPDRTIGEIVAADYRTAGVFESQGIDFCCGGKETLAAVCREKGIDIAAIAEELEAVKSEPLARSQNYAAWELPFLADYIIQVHHTYLNENTAMIKAYAHKIAAVHGAHHPELAEIAALFDRVAAEVMAHLREEEEVVFPAIKRAGAAQKTGAAPDTKDLETIRRGIEKLHQEHEEIGDALHRIRRLARGYVIPGDACNTFVVTYRKLQEFEADLHKHVHLENNVLFPRAAQIS